jgi:hypothetical protein
MRVAIAVINHGFFLDALLGHRQRDADGAVGFQGAGSAGGDFQRVQNLSRVAIGDFGEMTHARIFSGNFLR